MSHIWIVNRGDSEAVIAAKIADGVYDGTDLQDKFAGEISRYANVWEWIRDRIDSAFFNGIHTCDYIVFQTKEPYNGYQHERIAGIDTYFRKPNANKVHHIDFVSREAFYRNDPSKPNISISRNLVSFNNGISEDCPTTWLSSSLHYWLNAMSGQVPGGIAVGGAPLQDVDYTNEGLWVYLPDELQQAIDESQRKIIYLPKRYSASGLLSEDNGAVESTMGRLWLPTEVEVAGRPVQNNAVYARNWCMQYPVFRQSWNLYTIGGYNKPEMYTGNLREWALASAASGGTSSWSHVHYNGHIMAYGPVQGLAVPICFRLTA